MLFTFYVLYSAKADRYYIGHTSEPISERVRKHNSDHKGFTGKFQDWVVVYVESYPTKADAYKRELQVKGWKNRKRLESLFSPGSEHPD